MARSRASRWVLAVVTVAAVVPAAAGVGASAQEPDDPGFANGLQWSLLAIGAPQAWATSRGRGQVVAIVDTGIDADHPDLDGQVVGGATCLDTGGDPNRCTAGGADLHGHGTHVAGIVAARADNGIGIAGVAPEASLLAVRVLRASAGGAAEGSATDVAAGIRWAVDHGADVINLSLGTSDDVGTRARLAGAVEDAWARGVIVVAAARTGNLAASLSGLPLVLVTGLDRTGALAPYSRGVADASWGLAAPGGEAGDSPASCGLDGAPVGILSTWPAPKAGAGGYACLSGTSMAAPHVSGAAAILLAQGYTPRAAVERLLATAHDLGPLGPDEYYGSGGLDLAAAMGKPRAPGVAPTEADRPVGPQATSGVVVLADLDDHHRTSGSPAEEDLVRLILLSLAMLLAAALVIVRRRRAEEERRPPEPAG